MLQLWVLAHLVEKFAKNNQPMMPVAILAVFGPVRR